jgi:hypothetical protein
VAACSASRQLVMKTVKSASITSAVTKIKGLVFDLLSLILRISCCSVKVTLPESDIKTVETG